MTPPPFKLPVPLQRSWPPEVGPWGGVERVLWFAVWAVVVLGVGVGLVTLGVGP